ncbi:hypothetical protein RND71_042665 [Anisodus tanguticus]|uniref:Uncharacterized protein n=1 Tax=Anisodus tanguticus TaxID=243964 RepID=A0AAE1QST3_9SOLA|nr:hypothetical protein RND71_042665 [Anisodus tanguticus]
MKQFVAFQKEIQFVFGLRQEHANVKEATVMDSDMLNKAVAKLAAEVAKLSDVFKMNHALVLNESTKKSSELMTATVLVICKWDSGICSKSLALTGCRENVEALPLMDASLTVYYNSMTKVEKDLHDEFVIFQQMPFLVKFLSVYLWQDEADEKFFPLFLDMLLFFVEFIFTFDKTYQLMDLELFRENTPWLLIICLPKLILKARNAATPVFALLQQLQVQLLLFACAYLEVNIDLMVMSVASYETAFMELHCGPRGYDEHHNVAKSVMDSKNDSKHVKQFFKYVQLPLLNNDVAAIRLNYSNFEDKVLIGVGSIVNEWVWSDISKASQYQIKWPCLGSRLINSVILGAIGYANIVESKLKVFDFVPCRTSLPSLTFILLGLKEDEDEDEDEG